MPSDTAHGERGRYVLFCCIVCGVVVLDQVTKYLARAHLSLGESVPVIPGAFDFELVYNKGAAFGLMQNATAMFVIIALVILALIVFFLVRAKNQSRFEVVVLALIAAGAIGNCIDRVFQDGTVTDFIATAFMDFPVFNVADSSITIGCILFVFAFVFSYRKPPDEDPRPSEGEGTRHISPAGASDTGEGPISPEAGDRKPSEVSQLDPSRGERGEGR